MNNRISILIAATFVFAANGLVFAQPQIEGNTLRSSSTPTPATHPQTKSQSDSPTLTAQPQSSADNGLTPEIIAAMYNQRRNSNGSQSAGELTKSTARQSNVVVDSNVAPAIHAIHATPKKSDLGPIAHVLNSLPAHSEQQIPQQIPRSNVGTDLRRSPRQPERDSATANLPGASSILDPENLTADLSPADTETILGQKFDKTKFQTLIKRLGINTVVVMCFGIGFILVAKKFFNGTSPKAKKSVNKATIEIKSTLKLTPKSCLHLVEANDQQLIVAVDQTGIKSMVRLNESFASTLDSIEDLTGESPDNANATLAAFQAMSDAQPSNDVQPTDHSRPTNTQPANSAGAYSLGAIGRQKAAIPTPREQQATPPVKESREDEVRRKMEAALLDHGLKDLILDTLRKG